MYPYAPPRRPTYPYMGASPASPNVGINDNGAYDNVRAPTAPRLTYSEPAPFLPSPSFSGATSMPYAPPAPKPTGAEAYTGSHTSGWMTSLDRSRAQKATDASGAAEFARLKHQGVSDTDARGQAFDFVHAPIPPIASAAPTAAAAQPTDPKAFERYHAGLQSQALREYQIAGKSYDAAGKEGAWKKYIDSRDALNNFRADRAGVNTPAAVPSPAPAPQPDARVPYGAGRAPTTQPSTPMYSGGGAPRTATPSYVGDYSDASDRETPRPYAPPTTSASTPPYAGPSTDWSAAGAALASTAALHPYAPPTSAAPAQNTVQLTKEHASEMWNAMLRNNPGANRDELLPQFHDTLAKYGVSDQEYRGLLDNFLAEDHTLGPRVSTSTTPGTRVPISMLGTDRGVQNPPGVIGEGASRRYRTNQQSVPGPTISTPATVATGPRSGYSPISPDTSMLADRPGPAQPRSRQQQRPMQQPQQQGQVHPEIASAQLGATARSKSTGTIYKMTAQGWQPVQ